MTIEQERVSKLIINVPFHIAHCFQSQKQSGTQNYQLLYTSFHPVTIYNRKCMLSLRLHTMIKCVSCNIYTLKMHPTNLNEELSQLYTRQHVPYNDLTIMSWNVNKRMFVNTKQNKAHSHLPWPQKMFHNLTLDQLSQYSYNYPSCSFLCISNFNPLLHYWVIV